MTGTGGSCGPGSFRRTGMEDHADEDEGGVEDMVEDQGLRDHGEGDDHDEQGSSAEERAAAHSVQAPEVGAEAGPQQAQVGQEEDEGPEVAQLPEHAVDLG